MTEKEKAKLRIHKINLAVGRVVVRRRAVLNRSFDEVCKRARVTGSYLSQLENGKMNVSVNYLQRLAAALSMTGSGLLKQAEKEAGA